MSDGHMKMHKHYMDSYFDHGGTVPGFIPRVLASTRMHPTRT